MTIIHDQREIRSRTWGPSSRGVRCYVSLPAHGERGVDLGSPCRFDAITTVETGGRFGVRPFHSIASRLPPSGRGDRRRVNAGLLPRVRLVATFNSCFPQHFVRQDLYVPEAHVERLSYALVAYEDQHSERQLSREQKQVPNGATSG